MASDLISRKAVLNIVDNEWYKYKDKDGLFEIAACTLMKSLFDDVERIEAVDAVEVVRCKDCDFFWEYTAEYKAKVKKDGDCGFRCMNGGEDHFCMVTNDDYCSLARRKKNA